MISAWSWPCALAIGVAATVLGAAVDGPRLHMALTAGTCFGFAMLALLQRRRLLAAGASDAALSAAAATAMAVVWGWAALSLLITYSFFSSWHDWWQYVLGAGAVALLCLFFSAVFPRDAAEDRQDATMLSLARYLATGQLAGMVVAMIGLIIDAKMPRDPAEPDWAASAIFFFGAAALAAISADGLRRTASSHKR